MNSSKLLDNPYQQQQTVVITRIIGTVEKLNESMLELNKMVAQTNVYNSATAEVVELFTQYQHSLRVNLENSDSLHDPI